MRNVKLFDVLEIHKQTSIRIEIHKKKIENILFELELINHSNILLNLELHKQIYNICNRPILPSFTHIPYARRLRYKNLIRTRFIWDAAEILLHNELL